ncbi:A disintegrin and metalloproteinase with thrombospondin motifs like isoform X3 [Malaya genurostris]|uniref:A disintegrin and metalloproteinase with thrombospondin motifs like isoform X3 n=1 Tax=Malaya genurostris TaxID=325434 RepID=UPI0026F3982F|nr:A disintegrin and metalloproteinase with thrombospondin motifs like isoform X3 [Malaya genurostris]
MQQLPIQNTPTAKMARLGLYIAASWTIFCTYSVAMPDIHRQMSAAQLQEVFHVDHPDAVPNYELIKLIHHTNQPALHKRRKRSIETDSRSRGSDNGLLLPGDTAPHHVKKDLSKVKFSEKVSESLVPAKKRTATTVASDSVLEQEPILPEMLPPQQQPNQAPATDGSDSDSNKFSDVSIRDIKEHKVSFSAFGEDLNLTLAKTEGLFQDGAHALRMWNVRVDPNATQGLVYEEIHEEVPPTEDSFGNIYQDQQKSAAILMRKHLESGDLMMEGSIGHQLVIKPVPTEISQAEDGSVHHVIYKRTTSEEDQYDETSDYAFMEPDRLQKRFRAKRSPQGYYKSSRAIDTTIYPEILVIVDYDGYRLHGGDNVQVKRYFVSFWNGVDLRYRLLKGPRIRISIAGIIISRGRDATPYLERNRVGRDAIDSAAALTDMGKYLFRERRLPVYDIAVAITKLDMCRRQYANDACNRGTAGFAYVGGACVVNKRLEKVNSVAIIEDTGGFSGIIVAAHEVGHLLGAVHDGSPPPSYLGGPGAEKCRWEDGYIMSDLRHTERGFRWSPCSVQSFHHFLNGDTASCLHNPPHEDEALGRSLPGTLMTLDAQCRRDRGTSACFKDERVCAQLFCFDSASGYCVAYRPAAEGSSCGDGQHCLDGRCVAEHENIIPDYSQHTPSYARFNQQPAKYNYDDKSDQQEDYREPSSSTSSTTSTTSTTTTTTSTTTTTTPPPPPPPPPPPTSTRNYYQYFNHKTTMDDEDRRYKNFMNAIKRKRLQHLKEQLQQQEIVSNQQ